MSSDARQPGDIARFPLANPGRAGTVVLMRDDPSQPATIDPTDAAPADIDAIVEEFIRVHFDPVALAQSLGLSPLQSVDILAHPAVAARLDHYHAVIASTAPMRSADASRSAITALYRVVDAEDANHAQRRNAAAALLKAGTAGQSRKARHDPATDPPPPDRAQVGTSLEPTSEQPTNPSTPPIDAAGAPEATHAAFLLARTPSASALETPAARLKAAAGSTTPIRPQASDSAATRSHQSRARPP